MTTLFGPAHVERYRETDGAEGWVWLEGTHTLILTTTGRKSGAPRDHALIYREHPDQPEGRAWVIVASKGGAPEHPTWYANLEADPSARIQIKADVVPVRARTATGEERTRLWDYMLEAWPHYAEYATKTDRQIPIVVLDRA